MLKNICSMVFLCAVATACAQAPVSGADPGGSPFSGSGAVVAGSQQGDWAAIVKLEDNAKAIAKVAGCASSECRAAPVGSRACGGPRYYIPYCAKTTDSVALYRKLDEVAKAERAYNAKYKLVSTCEFRMPPLVEAIGGSCVAK
jgi:hypothetical protein